MEDLDAEFIGQVEPGDIIVGEFNFGCGSSREHAPVAIKASGISCVIGKSFARIFFRNAINIGLPLLECEEAVDNIKKGDIVEVDLATGNITNLSTGKSFTSKPYPDFMMEIVNAGGLVEHTKKKISGAK
jgi:3-isopropylmalate/(R)-2-methylmalate dehydratase small subunit